MLVAMKPNAPNQLNQFDRATVTRPLMRARLGACRGGELRPHHLGHPPETRQWVAADRDRLHTIEEGLPHREPAALGSRCRQPSGVRGRGPAASSITRLGSTPFQRGPSFLRGARQATGAARLLARPGSLRSGTNAVNIKRHGYGGVP